MKVNRPIEEQVMPVDKIIEHYNCSIIEQKYSYIEPHLNQFD